MAAIQLEIVTPERRVVSAEVEELIAPGGLGLFGVRTHHAPFITVSEPGELSYRQGAETHRYAIGGGFVEVEGDRVRVLADTAEKSDAIDVARAQKAKADATQRLVGMSDADPEYAVQQARLKRAVVRLQVAQRK